MIALALAVAIGIVLAPLLRVGVKIIGALILLSILMWLISGGG